MNLIFFSSRLLFEHEKIWYSCPLGVHSFHTISGTREVPLEIKFDQIAIAAGFQEGPTLLNPLVPKLFESPLTFFQAPFSFEIYCQRFPY